VDYYAYESIGIGREPPSESGTGLVTVVHSGHSLLSIVESARRSCDYQSALVERDVEGASNGSAAI